MLSRLCAIAALGILGVDSAAAKAPAACNADWTRSDEAPLAVLLCASRKGDRDAQYELGRRYALGIGVARDPSRSFSYLRKAATPATAPRFVYSPPVGKEGFGRLLSLGGRPTETGHSEAQFALAMAYGCGNGVKRSAKRAAAWLEKSSQGRTRASPPQFTAGRCHASDWWVITNKLSENVGLPPQGRSAASKPTAPQNQ